MIRNETGLYHALAEVLKVADRPMTCTELYAIPSVKRHATNANRVSDYLGNLWRDRLLKREPAARTEYSSARWAYSWRGRKNTKQIPMPDVRIIDLPDYTITLSITPKIK